MEKAFNSIVSELKQNRDHYERDHPVLYRAFDIMQIVMEIGPNRSAAMGKTLSDIIPEVMENREHYELEHPEIFRAVNVIVTARSDLSRCRRARHESNRKQRREEKPPRGRRRRK